jgi:hypothetical protein
LFSFYYHLFNLLFSLKDGSGSPELPIIPDSQHAMLYNPEAAPWCWSNRIMAWCGFQEEYPVALLV